ncbi:MAG: putative 2-aminoethylphosphonate ABC transporter permease subunit, partial [Comamonadaceae bacterium]
MAAVLSSAAAAPVKQSAHWTDRIAHLVMLMVALALVAFLALPLLTILVQAVQGRDEQFVGLANFIEYAGTPALLDSLW